MVSIIQNTGRFFYQPAVQEQVFFTVTEIVPDHPDILFADAQARSNLHFVLKESQVALKIDPLDSRIKLEGGEVNFLVIIYYRTGKNCAELAIQNTGSVAYVCD